MCSEELYHALTIDTAKCMGCTHCMQTCPTEAIRVKDGKARLIEDKCVDCGYCYNSCPVNAIYVKQDDFSEIFNYKYRVAIVPAVFVGQFPRDIPTRKIFSGLTELGFTHVYEAEHGVELLSERLNQYVYENMYNKPVVSSFCPAIVRLIQVKYPDLADNIMMLKSPAEIAALSFKKTLMDEGAEEHEIGLFYITPCAAKIAAVKAPVGEKNPVITGVINMNFIYNKVFAQIQNDNVEQCMVPYKEQLTNEEMVWSLTRGESKHVYGRNLAIDDIHNVIEFLDKAETQGASGFDFLELRACDQSCAGGILTTNNRFLTAERLENRANQYLVDKDAGKIIDYKSIANNKSYLVEKISTGKIYPRSAFKLDENTGEAIKKINRIRNLMCFLPGIDCGACGAPRCSVLAEDIVQKEAAVSSCVFIQKQMEISNKLDSEHALRIMEKTWGNKRFDKDCTKKGAKNEVE